MTVVNSARVSFNKQHSGFEESDKRLLKYLARHNHWSPFAHPKIQLRIKMPIFVHRQWDKSRVGFERNEVSRRYVDEEPEFYIPAEWRGKAEDKKQGSAGAVEFTKPDYNYRNVLHDMKSVYTFLTKNLDIAPEQARIILPLSTYTEFIETGSLYGYSRIHALRASEDAQWEIRQYANVIDDIMSKFFPHSWEALTTVPSQEGGNQSAVEEIEAILQRIRNEKYTEARQIDHLNYGG